MQPKIKVGENEKIVKIVDKTKESESYRDFLKKLIEIAIDAQESDADLVELNVRLGKIVMSAKIKFDFEPFEGEVSE